MVSKKMLVALAAASTLGMSLSTVAATACNTGCPGVYVGAQAGWGQVKYRNNHHEGRRHHNDDNGGFGGRVYLGYQFNPYIGLETGVAGFFKDSDHHHDRNGSHNNVGQWDLLARVGAPFGDSGFRGDIKGGAAYLFNGNDHHNGGDSDRIIPAAGASLAYSFCQNVMVDLSYLHGFGTDGDNHHHGRRQSEENHHHHHDSNRVKSTDLVTIGVSYLFPTM